MPPPAAAKKQPDAKAPATPVRVEVPEEEQSSFIDVDINRLDEAIAGPKSNQKLVKKWGDKAAEAKYDELYLKSQLDLVKARVELHIRENVDLYAIAGKLTEDGVKIRVRLHADVEAATNAYLQAKLKADKYTATCEALRERRDSINNGVILHGRQYFAADLSPDARKAGEEAGKAARKPLQQRA